MLIARDDFEQVQLFPSYVLPPAQEPQHFVLQQLLPTKPERKRTKQSKASESQKTKLNLSYMRATKSWRSKQGPGDEEATLADPERNLKLRDGLAATEKKPMVFNDKYQRIVDRGSADARKVERQHKSFVTEARKSGRRKSRHHDGESMDPELMKSNATSRKGSARRVFAT